jgi:hypothetical protein
MAAFLLLAAVPAGFFSFSPNRPETFADVRDHFKYGSIGAEGRTGLPYWIWLVLPRLGHAYGTDLNPAEKDDLLEYLKTL